MINITETKINYNILNKSIDEYRFHHFGNFPNYLIMNRKTMYLLEQDLNPDKIIIMHREYQEYHGVPISICEKLKDGEVDVI